MKLTVRIVSMFAICDPERDQFSWQGEIEIDDQYTDAPETEICELLFSLFNRHDRESEHRINEVYGYRLPSLSSADVVAFWPSAEDLRQRRILPYRVVSVGFKEILPGLGD